MRPKTVTPLQQPQMLPDDVLSASENLQPVWGRAVTQMLDGGLWDKTAPPERLLGKNGLPRRPKQVQVYEGEFVYEPDPAISSFTITWEVVRTRWRGGWSRVQIEVELSNPLHAAGAYYRFKQVYDKNPDALLDQIWSEVAESETNPYYRKQVASGCRESLGEYWPVEPDPAVEALLVGGLDLPRNRSLPPELPITRKVGNRKDFQVDEAKASQLWYWLQAHPGLSENQVTQQGPLSPRIARTYLHHLQAQGRATAVPGTIVTAAGRRTAKVWEVTEADMPVSVVLPPQVLRDLLAGADMVKTPEPDAYKPPGRPGQPLSVP